MTPALPGRVLSSRIDSPRRFKAEFILKFGLAILHQLQILQDRLGNVHYDLKPHNVIVDENPESARLIDFALMRELGREMKEPDKSLVHGGLILRQLFFRGFSSPERSFQLTSAVEVCALAVLMARMYKAEIRVHQFGNVLSASVFESEQTQIPVINFLLRCQGFAKKEEDLVLTFSMMSVLLNNILKDTYEFKPVYEKAVDAHDKGFMHPRFFGDTRCYDDDEAKASRPVKQARSGAGAASAESDDSTAVFSPERGKHGLSSSELSLGSMMNDKPMTPLLPKNDARCCCVIL